SPTTNSPKRSRSISPASTALAISALSSSTDPMIFSSFPSSVLQIGRGMPQYLDLERFQSLALASQLPNRPSPVALGFQLMPRLSSNMRSRTSVTLMNQESRG